MYSFRPSLFSFRNFVLMLLSVFTVRALGVGLDGLGGLTSELPSGPTIPLSPLSGDLDTLLFRAHRSDLENLVTTQELFILRANETPDTRRWLAFLAPANTSLDAVQQSTAIFLDSLIGSGGAAPSSGDSSIPVQVFFGLDLSEVQSLPLEAGPDSSPLPSFSVSQLQRGTTRVVPEPTSTILLLVAAGLGLRNRRR